jgi:hypothetical protein
LSCRNQPSWIACRVMENAPVMMGWLAITKGRRRHPRTARLRPTDRRGADRYFPHSARARRHAVASTASDRWQILAGGPRNPRAARPLKRGRELASKLEEHCHGSENTGPPSSRGSRGRGAKPICMHSGIRLAQGSRPTYQDRRHPVAWPAHPTARAPRSGPNRRAVASRRGNGRWCPGKEIHRDRDRLSRTWPARNAAGACDQSDLCCARARAGPLRNAAILPPAVARTGG